MTGQRTSLSLAALKQIIAGIDQSIAVFDRTGASLTSSEWGVRNMLYKLRGELAGQIDRHPENRR